MRKGLEQTPTSMPDLPVSAPPSADFYFDGAFEAAYHQGASDILLESDAAYGEAEHISAIFGLRNHMSGLLDRYRERYDRNNAAAGYSSYYRDELVEIGGQNLSYDEKSAVILGKVYLSTLGSLGQLGKFIETGKWTGRKSADSERAKVAYLASRKEFQEDVDEYFTILRTSHRRACMGTCKTPST